MKLRNFNPRKILFLISLCYTTFISSDSTTITATNILSVSTPEVKSSDGPMTKLLVAILTPIGLLAIIVLILILYIRRMEISFGECVSKCDQPKFEQRQNHSKIKTCLFNTSFHTKRIIMKPHTKFPAITFVMNIKSNAGTFLPFKYK